MAADETVNNVSVHRCWTTRFGRSNLVGRAIDYLSFYMAAFVAMLSRVRRGDIVVAMTDPPLLGIWLALAVRLKGGKQVNWLQDLFPEVAQGLGVKLVSGATGALLQKLRNANCRRAMANVAIGCRMADYLKGQEVPPAKLAVIRNWAPQGVAPVAPDDKTLRQEWGIHGCFVVGYSGNLGRAHEWHTIFLAAQALSDHPRIRFLFIGGGSGMAALRAEVRTRGIDNILFKPYQSREVLSESLSSIDMHLISLQPAVADYLVPSKVYGIAAVGRPAIFIGPLESEVGDILREGGFGKTVANGDVEALVREVEAMAENREDYERACRLARQAHDRHYTLNEALDAWGRLLSECGIAAQQPLRNSD